MAVTVVLMLERVEKRLGATPAAFPPPIFAGTASISVFRVSPLPSDRNHRGSLYIGVFRSDWVSRDEDGQHRRSEAQTSMGGATWLGVAPPVLKWASWPSSLTSCAPGASRGKILTTEKSQVNLSLGRSLKRKNTQNRFSVLQSYDQNKGDRCKIPIKYYETWL
jgi:hypothetical protein